MQVHPDDVHKLLAGLGVVHKGTGEVAGGGDAVLLLHTTHRHAHVLRLNDHRHAQRVEGFLYAVFNLLGEAFLYLQPAGKSIYHTWYLTQAHNSSVRNIRHMRLAHEGHHVMLAEGIELYVLHDNHLLVVLVEHGRTQYLLGVEVVSVGEEEHGLGYAFRGFQQALTLRIFTQQAQDGLPWQPLSGTTATAADRKSTMRPHGVTYPLQPQVRQIPFPVRSSKITLP